MFLAVGALLHQLSIFNQPPARRRNATLLILGTVIPISVYHCWTDEIIVHEIAFAVMVFLCGKKTRLLIREKVKSAESRKKLINMANFGLGELALSAAELCVADPSCRKRSIWVLPLEH